MPHEYQGDKVLFTPGPLTCSLTVKQAMLRDLGSRDVEFVDLVKDIREKLLNIADVSSAKFTSILLQGSGTYCVEAAIQTVVPRHPNSKVLLLVNGAYGRRMHTICECLGIGVDVLEYDEDTAVNAKHVEQWLRRGGNYALVCVVHCETSSGVLNPIGDIARVVRVHLPHAVVLVDAMSSFGAVPVELHNIDLLVSSANKCLQGVPGFSFVIARRSVLQQCQGNARCISLDLVAQLEGLERDGQFRFTPPTHALLAFHQALKEFDEEGGLPMRAARYQSNCEVIKRGMNEMGFQQLLKADVPAGNIITSFHFLKHSHFRFDEFYRRLSDMGQVIYPGKVTRAPCFRIGHIGALWPEHMYELLRCIKIVLQDMGVTLPTNVAS